MAIADVLGADLAVKAYPGTGPRIHDRIQARIVEELIRVTKPRWRSYVEVPVYRPARGFIDVVLADAGLLVPSEVQSDLRRLEQQLRWSQDKVRSLESADLWRRYPRAPDVSPMLVLRSTARTRELIERFPETLAGFYPARTADVFAAITGDAPWPGSGLLWATVDGDRVAFLPGPPRGVTFGR